MYVAPRHPPAIAKRIAQRLAAKEHPGIVPTNYDLARDAHRERMIQELEAMVPAGGAGRRSKKR